MEFLIIFFLSLIWGSCVLRLISAPLLNIMQCLWVGSRNNRLRHPSRCLCRCYGVKAKCHKGHYERNPATGKRPEMLVSWYIRGYNTLNCRQNAFRLVRACCRISKTYLVIMYHRVPQPWFCRCISYRTIATSTFTQPLKRVAYYQYYNQLALLLCGEVESYRIDY